MVEAKYGGAPGSCGQGGYAVPIVAQQVGVCVFGGVLVCGNTYCAYCTPHHSTHYHIKKKL